MPKKHSLNRHTAFNQSQVLRFLTAEIMTYTFKLSNHIKSEKCKLGDYLFSLPKGKGFSLKNENQPSDLKIRLLLSLIYTIKWCRHFHSL